MSDLIDLNASNEEIKTTPLVDPLIPAPSGPAVDRLTHDNIDCRLSLDNNPFDLVLKETAKNIRKLQDPFEMVMEKAFESKSQNTTPRLARYKDDNSRKSGRLSDLFKMNKSVDESMMKNSFSLKDDKSDLTLWKTAIEIPVINVNPPSPNESLAILNESAMNDTLLENICLEHKDKSEIEQQLVSSINGDTKVRSLSQAGTELSPKICRKQRSHSAVEAKIRIMSDCSIPSGMASVFFNDPFNKAFQQSRLSSFSGCSNASSISSISRHNSTYFSSSSNDTFNKAFVNSTLSDSVAKSTSFELYDLAKKFREIKLKSVGNSISSGDVLSNPAKNVEENINKENIDPSKFNNMYQEKEKLIDVDSPPEMLKNDEFSNSESSTDSVFSDNNTNKVINKSILHAAQSLSKTFQELAESSTSSNSDDLISSKPNWNFEELPVSDDEVMVDNLIELPISPSSNRNSYKSDDQSSQKCVEKNASLSDLAADVGFKDPKKKCTAVTLLLELQNLAKTENKPEAIKLLADLEKILGVNSESNMELLTTCLRISNDLSQSSIIDSTTNELSNENDDRINSLKDKEIDKNDKFYNSTNEKFAGFSESNSKIEPNTSEGTREEKLNEEKEKTATALLVHLENILTKSSMEASTLKVLKELGIILSKISDPQNEQESMKSSKNEEKVQEIKAKSEVRKLRLYPPRYMGRKSLGFDSKTNICEKTETLNQSLSHVKRPQTPPMKPKLRFSDAIKRYSSDPSIDTIGTKKKEDILLPMKKVPVKQDIKRKPGLIPDVHKGKPVSDIVKNKFKRRTEPEIISKKGPMKAVIPLINMQKQSKSISTFVGRKDSLDITPPKGSVRGITSSTPKSPVYTKKNKIVKSNPVASSTPTDKKMTPNRKRSESADTSDVFSDSVPIVPYKTTDSENSKTNRSSEKREGLKTPSPKKTATTPKVNRTPSSSRSMLPRFSPRPNVSGKQTSSRDRRLRNSVSPQKLSVKAQTRSKTPASEKFERKVVMSPLKTSNQNLQIKPFHLISKYRKGNEDNIAEKENRYT